MVAEEERIIQHLPQHLLQRQPLWQVQRQKTAHIAIIRESVVPAMEEAGYMPLAVQIIWTAPTAIMVNVNGATAQGQWQHIDIYFIIKQTAELHKVSAVFC